MAPGKSVSLTMPPCKYAAHSPRYAIKRMALLPRAGRETAAGQLPLMLFIDIVGPLNCPARAAQCAKEAVPVGRRNFRPPGRSMIVTMQSACTRAAARGNSLMSKRLQGVLAGPFRLAPSPITFEQTRGRPIRHGGRYRVVVQRKELIFTINNPPAYYGQVRSKKRNLVFRHTKIIFTGNDEVGELTCLDTAALAVFVGEPGNIIRPHSQCCFPIQRIVLRIQAHAAQRFAGGHPRDRHPGVIRPYTSGIRPAETFTPLSSILAIGG